MEKKSLPVEVKNFTYNYEKNPPIGIDLGTSNSSMAKWTNTSKSLGSLVYNFNDQNSALMPSVVYLDADNDFIVGNGAYKKIISEPENVVTAVKRKMDNASKNIILRQNSFSPIDITSEIIKAMFHSSISTGLRNPSGIAVSVPYHFTQNQNNNIRLAVNKAVSNIDKFANLPIEERPELTGLIPEPVAAALSYAIDSMDSSIDDNLLIFDLGGGTLDLTLINLNITGNSINFEVLSTDGDDSFGGEDFDSLLEDYIIKRENITTENLSDKMIKKQRSKIREEVKSAKENLSFQKEAYLIITGLPCGKNVDTKIKRSEFDSLLSQNNNKKNYYEKFEKIIHRTLDKTKLSENNVTKILPVGGSTNIPFFQKILQNTFPNANYLNLSTNLHDSLYLSVAKGAAIYSAYLLDKKYKTSFLPVQKEINIIERTSHSLGIYTNYHKFSVIMKANTIVPATAKKIYEPINFVDNQKKLVRANELEVYQGNGELIEDNTLIGKIKLPEIYAHGRNLEDIKIIIEFKVDSTNVKVFVKIPKGNLDKSDIQINESIHLEEKNI